MKTVNTLLNMILTQFNPSDPHDPGTTMILSGFVNWAAEHKATSYRINLIDNSWKLEAYNDSTETIIYNDTLENFVDMLKKQSGLTTQQDNVNVH